MRKRVLIAASATAMLAGLPVSSAAAAPPERADDPFVCPVLTVPQQAVDSSGKFGSIGGDGTFTFAPGSAGDADTFNGNVPNTATNDDGAGSPTAFNHASPGKPTDDATYTAIWSGN
jgi:ABC-type phosphate transport system substrate-binding protein